jgi:hypothetical protein
VAEDSDESADAPAAEVVSVTFVLAVCALRVPGGDCESGDVVGVERVPVTMLLSAIAFGALELLEIEDPDPGGELEAPPWAPFAESYLAA